MCTITIYILLGLAIGFLGGYAGIGGAPFMIAFLVLVCGIPQLTSQGSVLTMMLGPMSLLGIISMKKEVKEQLRNIIIGVFSYAIFSYFGAKFAFGMGDNNVKMYFGVLLVIVALIQYAPISKNSGKVEITNIPLVWMIVIGIGTGIIGGLFGIGAGVLMVPLFIVGFRLKKNYARALSLAILLPPVSFGAFIKYNAEDAIRWDLVAILFISYFIANYFGAKVGSKSSLSFFKKIYAVLLLTIASIYLFAN